MIPVPDEIHVNNQRYYPASRLTHVPLCSARLIFALILAQLLRACANPPRITITSSRIFPLKFPRHVQQGKGSTLAPRAQNDIRLAELQSKSQPAINHEYVPSTRYLRLVDSKLPDNVTLFST